MSQETYLTVLPKLGNAIDQALASWETYLDEIAHQPTYEAILSTDNSSKSSNTTKTQALQYLLSTLTLRYTALLNACMDPDADPVQLPEQCDNLLDELDGLGVQMELDGHFGSILRKGFVEKISDFERKVAVEEQCRKQELGRLKAVQMALMSVRADGELGLPEVEALVEAMEALGVALVETGINEKEA